MNISTKYNVGHKFWVPRCHEVWEKEELKFEDEVWYRNVSHFKGYAKQKIIVKIEVCVNKQDKVTVQYYVLNANEPMDGQMSSVYEESVINDFTEEQALAVAKTYEEMEEPYYGV